MVRLSGPRAFELARSVFPSLPAGGFRRADGELLLPGWPPAPTTALVFRGPRSYTGEDLVELWPPGSPPLIRRLLLHLHELGARQARPGEFSRRAFLGGRLDLTQAEAILALTRSEDLSATRAASRALAGGLGSRIDALKAQVVGVVAHVEAAIDFSEDEIDLAEDEALAERLEAVAARLEPLVRAGGPAGLEALIALRGAPNAGKSSLLNALCGRDAALVSARAGTTRDVVSGRWRLPSGRWVRLLDTAGELEPSGPVEAAALEAARQAAESADLTLYVVDGQQPTTPHEALDSLPGPTLLVVSKADLPTAPAGESAQGIRVSALSGEGLGELGAAVEHHLDQEPGRIPDLLGNARQTGLLAEAARALHDAGRLLRSGRSDRAELASLELGAALEALGQLTGVVTTDDVLDQIFGEFCIGK